MQAGSVGMNKAQSFNGKLAVFKDITGSIKIVETTAKDDRAIRKLLQSINPNTSPKIVLKNMTTKNRRGIKNLVKRLTGIGIKLPETLRLQIKNSDFMLSDGNYNPIVCFDA